MIDLGSLHAELLSAAAGEAEFDAVTRSIASAFSAGGSVVFDLNRRTGIISDWASDSMVIGGDGYDEHINAINPRMHYSKRHAAGHVTHDLLFASPAMMDRHAFYDWLSKFSGFRYFLGSRLYDVGDISVFHSMEFTPSHGPPDRDKIEAFGCLARAVGNAWRIKDRQAPGEDPAIARSWTPDHLPWAILALNASGEVVSMNAAAKELVSNGDAVALNDGHLTALHAPSRPALRRILSTGLRGEPAECLLETKSPNPPLIAQIVPANHRGACVAVPIAAILYLSSPLRAPRNIGPVLSRLYGFTPAEQALASKLIVGLDLKEAASRLDISRNTARNRLQSMYAKTGTNKQSAFLVVIGSVLESPSSGRTNNRPGPHR